MPKIVFADNIIKLTSSALAFAVGASLLLLGVPRTIDAIQMLPSDRLIRKILRHEPIELQELLLVINSEKWSIFWSESGRDWTALSLAQILLAEKIGLHKNASQSLLIEARNALKTGLALAPADPFAWTRLAYVENLIAGPSSAVAAALRTALLTGPYTPRLLFGRLELCFVAWPYFRWQDRDLVFRQVRLAWQDDPERLVTLAQDLQQVELVRAALSQLPTERFHFEELLR